MHLSVHPPNGKVTVAAPMRMSLDKIRLFAIAKLAWIKAQQKTLREMVHLLERSHGPRFVALMDQFMPQWRQTRKLLNRLPARHERWTY